MADDGAVFVTSLWGFIHQNVDVSQHCCDQGRRIAERARFFWGGGLSDCTRDTVVRRLMHRHAVFVCLLLQYAITPLSILDCLWTPGHRRNSTSQFFEEGHRKTWFKFIVSCGLTEVLKATCWLSGWYKVNAHNPTRKLSDWLNWWLEIPCRCEPVCGLSHHCDSPVMNWPLVQGVSSPITALVTPPPWPCV